MQSYQAGENNQDLTDEGLFTVVCGKKENIKKTWN